MSKVSTVVLMFFSLPVFNVWASTDLLGAVDDVRQGYRGLLGAPSAMYSEFTSNVIDASVCLSKFGTSTDSYQFLSSLNSSSEMENLMEKISGITVSDPNLVMSKEEKRMRYDQSAREIIRKSVLISLSKVSRNQAITDCFVSRTTIR